jgi:hypothetical protein
MLVVRDVRKANPEHADIVRQGLDVMRKCLYNTNIDKASRIF